MDNVVNNVTEAVKHAAHPFYPLEVEIAGYLANTYSVPVLLAMFAAWMGLILAATRIIVKRIQPGIPPNELLTLMWFVLTGSIHLFFEGYYSLNYKNMGGLQTIFGQLWKEYAHSDSRYLTQDAFVLCMETITAFSWGPLSFVTAWMIAKKHPMRHPLQMIISMGQLYGVILYYATSMFDHYYYDIAYSRPEAYYFWGYYFLTNFFWVVIPGQLIYNSCRDISGAFRALDKMKATLRNGNGEIKKSR